MTRINRIRIGETTYGLAPEIGKGLQFGTSVEDKDKLFVTLGTATANGIENTGISIKEGDFIIDTELFTAFLKGLGFKTE
jgi:hypothetical protein